MALKLRPELATGIGVDDTEKLNILDFGAKSSAAGIETHAAVNKAAWDAVLALHVANGGGTTEIPIQGNEEFYFDGGLKWTDNMTLQLDGIMARPKNSSVNPWMDLEGKSNTSLLGFGTIDGNSHVEGVREGGLGIQGTDATRMRFAGITVKDFPTFCFALRGCIDIRFDNVRVSNFSGSIKSGETNSGINQDGIHLINCSDWVVDGCIIEACDDSFAHTSEDGFNNDTAFNGILSNTFIHTRKPAASASSGDGSVSQVLNGGIRITGIGTPSVASLSRVTLDNVWMRGGGGIRIGETGATSSTAYRAVKDVTLNNIYIWDTLRNTEVAATDFDTGWNFATSASLWIRHTEGIRGNRIHIDHIGTRGIFIDSATDVSLTEIHIEDVVFDTTNYARTGEQFFGAINIEAVQGDVDLVHLHNIRIKDVDGSGIFLREAGSTNVTNLLIDGKLSMDNPNNLSTNSLTRQPISSNSVEGEDAWIEPFEYTNFAPQSSNHQRTETLPSFREKFAGLSIFHWSANVLSAGFTEISSPTISYPTETEFGYSINVQGGADVGIRSNTFVSGMGDEELEVEFVIELVSGGVKYSRTETTTDILWSTTTAGVYRVKLFHGSVASQRAGWFGTAASTEFNLYDVKVSVA